MKNNFNNSFVIKGVPTMYRETKSYVNKVGK